MSYIIAAFNAQETIHAAIESVLVQENVSIEVIVIDDGSSDGTAAVARGINDGRVRVVNLDRNRGPSAARNTGLRAATGDWVAVLDSDDTLASTRTKKMLDRAESSGATFVVDNLEIAADVGGASRRMFTSSPFLQPSKLGLEEFIDGNIMLETSGYALGYIKPLMRRSFVEEHGLRYREDLRVGEDFYFFASALAYGGSCATEPEPGYRYQVREDSLSSRLTLGTVRKLRTADDDFRRAHLLDPAAAAALARRTRSLEGAISFLEFRESVRNKSPKRTFQILRDDPSVVYHLRIPTNAKAQRAVKRIRERFRRR